MSEAITVLSTLVLSAGLVGASRRHSMRTGMLDTPNDRSSHSRPTPRGGGAGLIVAMLVGWVVADHRVLRTPSLVLGVTAIVLVAFVGWWDDASGGVRPRTRLLLQLLASGCLVPLILELPTAWPHVALLVVWWVFWAVASINVVNFMDGIDGLIGSQALIFGVHLVLLGAPEPGAGALGLSLAAAAGGFLLWNWPPAKIFMGDVGSGALGVTFVVAGLIALLSPAIGFVQVFAPLSPIFLDATLTLFARARRGERLSEAHRSHLYQRLANGGFGHARVTLLYSAASCVAVLAIAFGVRATMLSLALFLAALVLGGAGLGRLITKPSSV